MIIAVGFDGTVVEQDGRSFDDTKTPLRLRPGALPALRSLRAADHVLVLTSSRANLALRENPLLDPLVAAGIVALDRAQWQRSRGIHEARYAQMVAFVGERMAGVFHAVDDGSQGPIVADMRIDGGAVRQGHGALGSHAWHEIAATWGAVYPARKRGA